ncbi:hypothetical protein AZ78_1334 [Lysobacter capsici AZ78]|uniref:Uncharacterized protein n=1 Tax=Lysobacter capsici AZ78 TaxID=1444315 RepID=A0A120AFY7_9GAMM|nr:hypothetical protein AZ78_1334 [Lysobacter capsici AZ78]
MWTYADRRTRPSRPSIPRPRGRDEAAACRGFVFKRHVKRRTLAIRPMRIYAPR